MRYLIFADSHRNVSAMIEAVNAEKCDTVIHLGDIESDVDELKREFPQKAICAVSGNNDGYFSTLPKELILTDNSHSILLCHGHIYRVKIGYDFLIANAIKKNCDIVLFGHTHTSTDITENGVHIINPGSIGNGTYAILNIDGNGVNTEIKHLSGE